ncbi:MAG: hypothetical protein LBG76_03405 [Treponema sp.]|nr:hypothetical protein [Treponema sp.]
MKFFAVPLIAFFLYGGGLWAQDKKSIVSTVPFRGSPQNLVDDYFSVLSNIFTSALPEFTPVPVDMNNLPSDVPANGQPAYVCPSPSLTKEAPYALTGEVTLGEDGQYHLRLYLWDTTDQRLIFSDEVVAQNRQECEDYLPGVLNWIFSWQAKEKEKEKELADALAVEAPPPVVVAAPVNEPKEKWLYLGLRGGGSLRLSAQSSTLFWEDQSISFPYITPLWDFVNMNAAFHIAVHLFTLGKLQIDVQAEAIFTTDHASFTWLDNGNTEQSPFKSMSLMFPLLARFSLRENILSMGIQGGVYYTLPLGQMENKALVQGSSFDYALDLPLGYTAGIYFGVKAGPGSLFLDARWADDLGEFQNNAGEPLYHRSMIIVNFGYELGIITKTKKEKAQKNASGNEPSSGKEK